MPCIRCKSELPKDSNFCPACGFTNDAAIAQRSMNVNQAVEEKIKRGKLWRRFNRYFWFLSR